jgi:hypothetical protein
MNSLIYLPSLIPNPMLYNVPPPPKVFFVSNEGIQPKELSNCHQQIEYFEGHVEHLEKWQNHLSICLPLFLPITTIEISIWRPIVHPKNRLGLCR